jgi:uncharacterized DUF497 family protein
MIGPEFEWDDSKAQRNLARHGVAFEAIRGFDWSSCVTFDDLRFDYRERRQVSFGLVGERLHVVVWTDRQGRRRLISFRRANRRETRDFYRRQME